MSEGRGQPEGADAALVRLLFRDVRSLSGASGLAAWSAISVPDDESVIITRVADTGPARIRANQALRLSHPNVARTRCWFAEDGSLYIVSEGAGRANLTQRAGDIARSSWKQALDRAESIVLAVGEALRYAHGEQIVHGGLGAEHVLLDESGGVVVGGWAVAAPGGEVPQGIRSDVAALCRIAADLLPVTGPLAGAVERKRFQEEIRRCGDVPALRRIFESLKTLGEFPPPPPPARKDAAPPAPPVARPEAKAAPAAGTAAKPGQRQPRSRAAVIAIAGVLLTLGVGTTVLVRTAMVAVAEKREAERRERQVEGLLKEGYERLLRAENEEAVQKAREALAVGSESARLLARAHAILGYGLIWNKEGDSAKRDEGNREAGIALNATGGEPIAHAALGSFEYFAGRDEPAAHAFEEALKLDPDLILPRIGVSYVYERQKRYSDAEARLREAIARDDSLIVAHRRLAEVYRSHSYRTEAIREYERVRVLDPGDALARARLGVLYYDRGETAEATDALEAALRIDAELASAHLCLGHILRNQGKYEEAANEYRAASDAFGRKSDADVTAAAIQEARNSIVEVPRVRGDNEATALQELGQSGLRPGTRSEAYDPEAEAGTVLSQSPEPGKKMPRDGLVDLVVSKGKEPPPISQGLGLGATAIPPPASAAAPTDFAPRVQPSRPARRTPTPAATDFTPRVQRTVTLTICADSGNRATRWCPETLMQTFAVARAPRSICRLHRPRPGGE